MVKNLEWCTKKYNNNYGHRLIKAADAHKKKIISINLSDDSKNYFNSVKEAGDYIGIKATNISAVLNNRKIALLVIVLNITTKRQLRLKGTKV